MSLDRLCLLSSLCLLYQHPGHPSWLSHGDCMAYTALINLRGLSPSIGLNEQANSSFVGHVVLKTDECDRLLRIMRRLLASLACLIHSCSRTSWRHPATLTLPLNLDPKPASAIRRFLRRQQWRARWLPPLLHPPHRTRALQCCRDQARPCSANLSTLQWRASCSKQSSRVLEA